MDRPFRGKPVTVAQVMEVWRRFNGKPELTSRDRVDVSKPKAKPAHAGPVCQGCGYLTRPMGNCHFCDNCMTSTGCS